ncbi:PRC-barrel domain-containing protein [Paenibacillus eucommiae]|uniref:Uncharacterized protein YrrD n=1 Tax=Paenibacillus eucommiae TaxID=1355755 RepID=A0ABS4J7B7_9BACL|nr:PRC-barrel domain-containing protein [Paenibacillus eucommiae]MBP1995700.1 uncharacterized protein YrrD [Paenibacillus eucommiae]
MRKAHEWVGLPVLAINTGKQLGRAKDLVIDDAWMITGIILESKQWFASLRYISSANVAAFGEDAITVADETAVQDLDDEAKLNAFIGGTRKIKGLPVITVGGEQLGIVEDVYLAQDWGTQIIGYELSEGFISDVKDGRKWLPMPDQAVRGENAIIVSIHRVRDLEVPFVTKEE